MERSRLKNIIILILALMDIFLLFTSLNRAVEERFLLRRTESELVELFAASGITLDADSISWDTPSAGVSISRSDTLERSVAVFLLGKDLNSASQGGINSFSSQRGAAQFRSGGSFEAAGTLSDADGITFCRSFCDTFSYTEPTFTLDETGTGTAVAVLQYEKRSVYNAIVTFRLENEQVCNISGTLLPTEGGSTLTASEPLLSSAAALTAFQQMRQEESTVASSILATRLCYELQGSSLTLNSAWCIVTDIATYYVNCSTGAITVG